MVIDALEDPRPAAGIGFVEVVDQSPITICMDKVEGRHGSLYHCIPEANRDQAVGGQVLNFLVPGHAVLSVYGEKVMEQLVGGTYLFQLEYLPRLRHRIRQKLLKVKVDENRMASLVAADVGFPKEGDLFPSLTNPAVDVAAFVVSEADSSDRMKILAGGQRSQRSILAFLDHDEAVGVHIAVVSLKMKPVYGMIFRQSFSYNSALCAAEHVE